MKIIKNKNNTANLKNKNLKEINLKELEATTKWAINKDNEIIKENTTFTNITKIMKQKLENVSLKPNTIHLIIKYVMELIEQTPKKGVEQKELALKVIRELFKDLTEGEDEIVLLKLLEDGSISNLIDLVVDATNGKINVNNVIETSLQCTTTCIPYCIKNKNQNKSKKSK